MFINIRSTFYTCNEQCPNKKGEPLVQIAERAYLCLH